MSRDGQASRGTVPTPAAHCTCGHSADLHNLNIKRQRTECSTWSCDCRRFVNREVAGA